MTTLTVSLIQLDVRDGAPETNVARARAMVHEAVRRGSQLIVLPELWPVGYALERASDLAAPLGEGPFAAVDAWAREHRVWITGSFLERTPTGFANTAVLFTPEGPLSPPYRKIHLFRLMDEDQYLESGDETPVYALPFGPVALAICYDVRFPELFRLYGERGARLVILPAEWPHPRLHHWRTLVQARAIENQVFMLACNRVGESKGTRFFGHSMVVSPWGEVLLEAGEQEVILTTEIDLDEVTRARQRIPVWEDKRLGVQGLT